AGASLASVWPELRADPGLVLLAARSLGDAPGLPASDLPVLADALAHLQAGDRGFVTWEQPGPDRVYRACLRQAQLASAIARRLGQDVERAWVGGLLAPLGWLAACAVDPAAVNRRLRLQRFSDGEHGLDHAAVTRRLARRWRLPPWLTPLVGHLGPNADV